MNNPLRKSREAGHEYLQGTQAPIQCGNQAILIVEDETSVLFVTRKILERLGYRVLACSSPVEAIRVAVGHAGGIDLLMTDVIMPEMNGRELADRILSIRPGIRVLFASGYTADELQSQGVLDEAYSFIEKPFSLKTLSATLRAILCSSHDNDI